MIPLLEFAYLSGLPIALGAIFLCFFARKLQGFLALVAGLSVSVWSFSVWRLSVHYTSLESTNASKVNVLIGEVGPPSIRIACVEGDAFLIYRIQVWPWRKIVVFNIVDDDILMMSPAGDFHIVVDQIRNRSEPEREMAARTVKYLHARAEDVAPIMHQ